MQATATFSGKTLAYLRRLIILIWGLFLCSVGIVFTYRSDMGLGPWDVLHKGVSLHTPLSFGQASIVVGGLIILVGLCLRVRPGDSVPVKAPVVVGAKCSKATVAVMIALVKAIV